MKGSNDDGRSSTQIRQESEGTRQGPPTEQDGETPRLETGLPTGEEGAGREVGDLETGRDRVGPAVEIIPLDEVRRVVEVALAIKDPEQWAIVQENRIKAEATHAEGIQEIAEADVDDEAKAAAVKKANSKLEVWKNAWARYMVGGSKGIGSGQMGVKTVPGRLGDMNRSLNWSRVEQYQADMVAGRWFFSPDPIVISIEGEVLNGQHRLTAVLGIEWEEGDKIPSFVVVTGVDKKAALVMDEARRTANDRRDIALRFAESI